MKRFVLKEIPLLSNFLNNVEITHSNVEITSTAILYRFFLTGLRKLWQPHDTTTFD